MKTFLVIVKIPVRVRWTQEIVEDDSNFYVRLTPHVMTGGGDGAPRLTRTMKGNVARYMTTRQYRYNQVTLEDVKKQAVEVAKSDPTLKKAVVAGARGQNIPIQVQLPSYTPQVDISPEDYAAGNFGRGEDYEIPTSTRWTKKQYEEITKEQKTEDTTKEEE